MLASLLHFESVRCSRTTARTVPQRAFVAELERQLRPGEWILFDQGVLPSAERLGYVTLLELSSKRIGEASFDRRGIWKELKERPSFLTAVSDGKATQIFEKQEHPAPRADGQSRSIPANARGRDLMGGAPCRGSACTG